MPIDIKYYGGKIIPQTWSTMPRWRRKEFHQENASRIRRGLNPHVKP